VCCADLAYGPCDPMKPLLNLGGCPVIWCGWQRRRGVTASKAIMIVARRVVVAHA
ncbi:hypothetical protein NDU88_004449, partial [Pleurodeles waltl]